MNFTYLYQPPKRWTFAQPKLKEWVESWCRGKVLNLFAGKTRLDVNEVRVDISDKFEPDFCCDALEFISKSKQKFGTIILDPPYNWRKAKEKYHGNYIGSYPRLKNELIKITKQGSRVISLGYDSVGMSKSRGFEKIAIALVCHSGDFHDTICVVEEKMFTDITDFKNI